VYEAIWKVVIAPMIARRVQEVDAGCAVRIANVTASRSGLRLHSWLGASDEKPWTSLTMEVNGPWMSFGWMGGPYGSTQKWWNIKIVGQPNGVLLPHLCRLCHERYGNRHSGKVTTA